MLTALLNIEIQVLNRVVAYKLSSNTNYCKVRTGGAWAQTCPPQPKFFLSKICQSIRTLLIPNAEMASLCFEFKEFADVIP